MVSCFHKYFAISKVYSNLSMSSFYDSFLRLKHAKVKRFVCSLKLYLPHNLCITTNEYDKLHMSHFSVYIFLTFLILPYCCPKDGDTETKRRAVELAEEEDFGTSTQGQVNYTKNGSRTRFSTVL